MKIKNGIAIDIRTLIMDAGGRKIHAGELLEIYGKTGTLLYDGGKGNKPISLDKKQGVFVDISKLSQEKIDEIYNTFNPASENIKEDIDNVLEEIKEKNRKTYDLSDE